MGSVNSLQINRKPLRGVFVDDLRVERFMAEAIFKSHEHWVIIEVFSKGRDALARVLEGGIDFMITDLNLVVDENEDLDGVEVANKAKEYGVKNVTINTTSSVKKEDLPGLHVEVDLRDKMFGNELIKWVESISSTE